MKTERHNAIYTEVELYSQVDLALYECQRH